MSKDSSESGAGRVAGKVALVTGAASGLGYATAMRLALEGASVLLTDIDGASVDAAAVRVAQESGGRALAVPQDVTDEAGWGTALEIAEAQFGGLNILVNNAGIGPPGTVEDTSLAQWRQVHAVDLDSVFLGCKHALPLMAKSGPGSIINVSSVAGIIAAANLAAYNSAKAAVRHLTKSVALHCARQSYPVRCNSVHPAFVDTPILDQVGSKLSPADVRQKMARQIPLGRIGKPAEIASAILYLASDESSFMTGAEMVLDGGVSAM